MTSVVTVEPFLVAALAALLDDGLPAPQPGEPLPPYWHVAACSTPAPTHLLGADGHPRAGLLAPPEDLPRRMFAGGSLHIERQLVVGERLEHSETVRDTSDKAGRSGRLRFVTVEHRLSRSGGAVAQTEQQRVVYREPTGASPAGSARPSAPVSQVQQHAPGLLTPGQAALRATLCADPVALQRFSAVTSNAHRIHYDYPYVTGVEGYPGLVVHGPLVLLALLELVRLDDSKRTVTDVDYTASAPAFCGEEISLTGTPDGDQVTLQASAKGQVVMTAVTQLAPR